MKDTILDDYLFEKERIEFHCDEIINTIRLHGDLVFKTEKGKKFKDKLIKNAREIKYILEVKLEEFFKADHDYKKFKHHYSTQEVIVHDLKKDPNDLPEDDETIILLYSLKIGPSAGIMNQAIVTYNKSMNVFKNENFTINPECVNMIAWHKTINYKEIKNER